MSNRKVFLDLEDTVITTWDDATLINVGVVRDWLKNPAQSVSQVRIFSFAIWDEKDKLHFVNSGMKAMLERALDVEVVEWLSVDEMQRIVEGWSGFRFESRTDFMQLHGKHDAFTKVCLAREERRTCVLLDDAVPNRTVIDHTRLLTIDLLPVQHLTGKSVGNEKAVARL